MTALVLLGFGLLLSYPWFVGAKPGRESAVEARERQARYAVRIALYVAAVSVTFFGSAVCAVLLARRTRERFVDESMKNLADLLAAVPPKKKDDDGAVE